MSVTTDLTSAALRHQTRPEFRRFVEEYKLSGRESDVLASLLSRLISNDDIAKALGLSPNTVSNHLKSIYSKSKSLNKTELMCMFAEYCLSHLDVAKRFSRVPKILVVDDEEDIRELLVDHLSAKGLKVEEAGDVSSALEKFRQFSPDVVVSDLRMPNESGLDLIRKVRLDYNANPLFIFITGYEDFGKEKCMAEGAADYFTKPCDFDALYDRIMVNYIERPEERARYLGVNPEHFEQMSYKLLRRFDQNDARIGHGGVFLPTKDGLALGIGEKLDGSLIRFNHQMSKDGPKVEILGEVVWTRAVARPGLVPGIGIRFVLLSEHDHEALRRHARESGSVAFIPLGTDHQALPKAV